MDRWTKPEFKWFEGSAGDRVVQFIAYVIAAVCVCLFFQAVWSIAERIGA